MNMMDLTLTTVMYIYHLLDNAITQSSWSRAKHVVIRVICDNVE